MSKLKKPMLLEVINDTSSTVVLKCKRAYVITNGIGFILQSYKKGEMHPRNCISLRDGHWKIAPKKYQNSKTLYKLT